MRLAAIAVIWAVVFLQTGESQSLCNPISRFQCNNGVCISIAKKCNGYRDCNGGEDEIGCDSVVPCQGRNTTIAQMNMYPCKGPCRLNEYFTGCRGVKKVCMCDDECGNSCVNPASTCDGRPPNVAHAIVQVKRMDPDTDKLKLVRFGPPYHFRDVAEYICERGRKLVGPFPRCSAKKNWSDEIPRCVDTVCHGPVPEVRGARSYSFGRPVRGREEREILSQSELPLFNYTVEYDCAEGLRRKGIPPRCNVHQQWTEHTVKCVVPCFEDKDPDLIRSNNLRCGQECNITLDCPEGMECYCDGPCSRACVNPNVTCGNATNVPNTLLSYHGQGIRRIARYQCQEGFYLKYGQLSLQCSGSGNWIGDLPVCLPVQCGDPTRSIRRGNGDIYDIQGTGFGDVVQFYCGGGYRMLGAPQRQCMGNGRWSGKLTVCDRIDDDPDAAPRCPHPGSPINGRLIGDDFRVGATVRFICDEGYVMYGSPVQTCLWYKQWNGTATPTCDNPEYPHSASDVIGTLTRTLENLPQSEAGLGRSIGVEDIGRTHEIYFVIDVSQSVIKKPKDLKHEIAFAKRLVRRMKLFQGSIKYGIMLFASTNVTVLDIAAGENSPSEVIRKLDEVYEKAADREYQRETRSGTATALALRKLQGRIAFMKQNDNDAMRHVFLFTDGQHTEGGDPRNIREEIEGENEGSVEFYSITACRKCNSEAQAELKGLSTGEDGQNYIFIEDFYQLQSYLDKVTNVTFDFGKCGQAGDVGSIAQQASLGRSLGGERASQNAWPWQALITRKGNDMKQSLKKNFLLGGGSILNEKWILTAAHVCANKDTDNLIVFVGIFERPTRNRKVSSSVEAYLFADYIHHPEYESEERGYDIALIKLGHKLNENLDKIEGEANGLTYTYYIRPVCLPCTGTCLKKNHLVNNEGDSLVNDDMEFHERCLVEETLLLRSDAKAVVTGFGHVNSTLRPLGKVNPAKKLRQALLKIKSLEECEAEVDRIRNIYLEDYGDPLDAMFSDTMMCCVSGDPKKVIDACKGDSGGPLVREVRDDVNGDSCWVQIGIVSWGYGCGLEDEFPGYYTNVAKFIPWINETIGGTLPGL